jgi:hypothetical protein
MSSGTTGPSVLKKRIRRARAWPCQQFPYRKTQIVKSFSMGYFPN